MHARFWTTLLPLTLLLPACDKNAGPDDDDESGTGAPETEGATTDEAATDTDEAATEDTEASSSEAGDESSSSTTGDPDDEATSTPLVLRFAGAAVELTAANARSFDLSGGAGTCLASDWPAPATPWLALDRDHNGTIDDARELFGSGVILRDGRRASDGFAALAELDADGDRRITPADPAWPDLLVWTDHDGDRRSTLWELEPVSARGLEHIDLDYSVTRDCDDRGNCGIERAAMSHRTRDGRITAGEVVDLHLVCR